MLGKDYSRSTVTSLFPHSAPRFSAPKRKRNANYRQLLREKKKTNYCLFSIIKHIEKKFTPKEIFEHSK